MKVYIPSILTDFAILAVVAFLLFATENTLFRGNVRLYEIAWVIIVFAALLTIFLRPRNKIKNSGFPKELVKTIENSLPHEAIKLFQNWYLGKLNKYHSFIKKRLGIERSNEQSKELAIKIAGTFARLSDDLLYKALEDRNKDNAIVSIIFFTVLLNSLSEFASNSIFDKPVSKYRDVFNIISLNDAETFLFREHYRLYEIGTILGDNFSNLNINADIQDILGLALDQQKEVAHKEIDSSPLEGNSKSPEQTLVNISEDNDACNKDTSTTSQNNEHATETNNGTEISSEDNIDATNDHTAISNVDRSNCDKFIKWLQRQLKRNPVNEGFYFFQDQLFGNNCLFISDTAFVDFSKKSNLKVNDIKHSLVTIEIAKPDRFKLSKEGQPSLPLTAIEVDFNLECLTELDGKIEEGES